MANEKRLIDANAMREDWLENGENEYVYDTNTVLDSIDAQPTVDAVEVVRCRDCKHHGGVVYGNRCKKWSAYQAGLTHYTEPDDFCSYGERREGE